MNKSRVIAFASVITALLFLFPAISEEFEGVKSYIENVRETANERDPNGLIRKIVFQIGEAEYSINASSFQTWSDEFLAPEIVETVTTTISFLEGTKSLVQDSELNKLNIEQMQEVARDVVSSDQIKLIAETGFKNWAMSEIDYSISSLQSWIDGEYEENILLIVQAKISDLHSIFSRIVSYSF